MLPTRGSRIEVFEHETKKVEGLSKRENLWLALSDLFLDTDTRGDLPRIALAAFNSGFSWEVIEQSYLEEVAPVVAPNLMQVAGDWMGFPQEWLFEQIRGRVPGTTCKSRLVTDQLHDEWLVVSLLYHRLLELPPELREERCRGWLLLARHFQCRAWPDSHLFSSLLECCTIQSSKDWLGNDFSWLSGIYRPLWTHAGDPTDEQTQSNWKCCQELTKWLSASSGDLVPLLLALQVLFVGQQLNSRHPVFSTIRAEVRRAGLLPHEILAWLQSGPWSDWAVLAEPKRRAWAMQNWKQHLVPLLSVESNQK